MTKKAETKDLSTLIYELRNNKICLPTFQREFVWKPKQIASLIMSIMRGYPVGSFLFLNYASNKNIEPRSIANIKIDDPRECKYIVMDGQQRLTSIWLATHQGDRGTFDYRGYYYTLFINLKRLDKNTLHDLNEDFVNAYFVWDKDDEYLREENYEKHLKDGYLPLYILLDKKRMRAWLRNARGALSKTKRKLLKQLSYSFYIYEIPIEKISYPINDQALCNIFQLINEAGTDLDDFDLAVARMKPYDIDLRKLWFSAKNEHRCFSVDKYNLDPNYILRTIVLYRKTCHENEIHGQEMPVTLNAKDIQGIQKLYPSKSDLQKKFESDWNKSVRYINEALEHISENFGADYANKIPYSPMIIVLAAIMWWANDNAIGISKWVDKINNWYWCSVFKNLYEKSTNEVIGKHFFALRKWIKARRGQRPKHFSRINISRNTLEELTSSSNAIYRGVLCLPYVNNARDIYKYNKKLVDSKVEDHHIFPKDWLGRNLGISVHNKKVNCVLNRTFILMESNRKISAKEPARYFKDLDDNIYSNKLNKQIQENLKRHFIDKIALEYIRNNSFDGFIKRRAKLICDFVNNDLIA